MYVISNNDKLVLCNAHGRVVATCLRMKTVLTVMAVCYPTVKAVKVMPRPQDIGIMGYLAEPKCVMGITISL